MRTLLILSSLTLAAASQAVVTYTLTSTSATGNYSFVVQTNSAIIANVGYAQGSPEILSSSYRGRAAGQIDFQTALRYNSGDPLSDGLLIADGSDSSKAALFVFDHGVLEANGTYQSTQSYGRGLNFGAAPGSATLTVSGIEAVPEPATMAALGLGAAAMLRRRRKA